MSDDLVKEAKALAKMSLAELKVRYEEVFGEEPVTRNTKVLREQIQRRLFTLEIDRKKSEIPPKAGKERAAKGSAGGEKMDASATTQISRLQKLGLDDLRTEYEKAFGKPTKSRNRKWLFTAIAKRLQVGDPACGEGDAPPEPKRSKAETGGSTKPTLTAKFEPKRKQRKAGKKSDAKKRQPKPIGARDPRLPKVGTTIERTYKSNKLLVRVLENGFEYEGSEYRSLSKLAQVITGAKAINGYLFFELGQYAKKEKGSK